MRPRLDCPPIDEFRKLLAGKLDERQLDRLARHLEECQSCPTTLAGMGDDTLATMLRGAGRESQRDPGGLTDLIERFCRLRLDPQDATGSVDMGKPSAAAVSGADLNLDFLAPSQATDELGRLDGYRVLRVLGVGGMGVVFEAEDVKLKRRVALKVMRPEIAANATAKDRFLREAQAAAALTHDHVVTIYQVGEDNGVPFIALQFLHGETLADRLKREGTLPAAVVVRLGREMAMGLAAAHSRGLIHRDIKPANVWLETETGRVKILDFGLARLAGDTGQLTQSGAILGTPAYMAPEQARGKSLDGRADLFSLGVVLYEAATGERPFTGPDTMAILSSLALDHPPEPRELNPAVPVELSQLIMRLLAKDPTMRPASADEVTGELRRMAADATAVVLEPAANPWADIGTDDATLQEPPPPEPKPTPAGRKRGPALAIALAACALFVGVAFGVYELVFKTKDGTLIVKIDDPSVEIKFKDGELHVAGADGKARYTLKPGTRTKDLPPGRYSVRVSGADGVKLDTSEFTMEKNGEVTLRVQAWAPETVGVKPGASGLQPARDRRLAFRSGGDWRLEGGELVQAAAATARIHFGDPNWTDYDLEVEVMSQSMVPNGHGSGVIFRAKSQNSYHDLEIGGWSATVTESVFFKDGKWGRSPGCFLKIPHEHGRWYKARVELRGSTIRGSVDGKELFLFEDADLPHGMVGLATGNSPVRWRNLKVTAPDGRVLWEGFPEIESSTAPASDPDRRAAEWVLSIGGELTLKANGKTVPVKKGMSLPAGPFQVTAISIMHPREIVDADLDHLKPLTGALESLTLLGCPKIGDAGLARLVDSPAFASLKRLSLNTTGVTDAGLALVTKFKWLDELAIGGSPVTTKGLAALGDMKLKSLTLYECHQLVDEAFTELARLPELTTLELAWTPISDTGLAHLAKCAGLRRLVLMQCEDRAKWLKRTPMTEAGVKKLASLQPNLRIEHDGVVIEPRTTVEGRPAIAAAPFDAARASDLQATWAKHLGRNVVEPNGVGMKMTLIPPGKFLRGAAEVEKGGKIEFKFNPEERPQHQVELTRPIAVSATEVTQGQFETVMGRNPSTFAAGGAKAKDVAGIDTKNLPVEMVTWFDAIEFCNKLSEKEKLPPYYELKFSVRGKDGSISAADVKALGGPGYRMPTEAEWEFACRAGSTGPFAFEFDYGTMQQHGWFGYSSGRPHAVGDRKPNAFGLCDMHGNVHEWCWDWFGNYSGEARRDPTGPASGSERIMRGGAYNFLVQYARSAWRGRTKPGARYDNFGIRVVRFIAESNEAPKPK